jgi:hypothetical protein
MDATICKKGGDGARWRHRSARRAGRRYTSAAWSTRKRWRRAGCVVDEEEVEEGELQVRDGILEEI